MRKTVASDLKRAQALGARSDLERARDAAMLHALFFWQLAERAVNMGVRERWEARGNQRMADALLVMKSLGDVPFGEPGYAAARRGRRRAAEKT